MASRKKPKPKRSKKVARARFTQSQLTFLESFINSRIELHEIQHHQPEVEIEEMTPVPDGDPLSDDLMIYRNLLANGYDLTPPGFALPPKASYFSKQDDGESHNYPGFTDQFMKFLEQGDGASRAYIRTCSTFGLPDYERRKP